jgi:hypothetical protein
VPVLATGAIGSKPLDKLCISEPLTVLEFFVENQKPELLPTFTGFGLGVL